MNVQRNLCGSRLEAVTATPVNAKTPMTSRVGRGRVLAAIVVAASVLALGNGCGSATDKSVAQNNGNHDPGDLLPGDGGKGGVTNPGNQTNSQAEPTTLPDTGKPDPPAQQPAPSSADDPKKPLTLPAGNYGGTKLVLADEIEFMGSKAKGNRVCIIADKSNSMKAHFLAKGVKPKAAKDGRAIDYLKAELHKTLKRLNPGQEFFIIFFDATPEPMPSGHWLKSSEADKVIPWIDNVTMNLGTKPLPAFKQAFQLNPKPDVIFFMTDGQFKNILPDLDRLNQGTPKVVINTIQLQSAKKTGEPGVLQLQEMAARAGGTFTIINAASVAK